MTEQLQRIPRQLRVVFFLVVIVSVFTSAAKAYELSYNEIKVSENGKESVVYKTSAETVGEFLKDENIKIGELDKISNELTAPIEDNMKILINRAFDVKVVIDGEHERTIKTNEVTVGRVVLGIKKETGLDYALENGMSSSTKLTPGMTIKLQSAREEITVKKESIPFETQTVENSSMFEGETKVKTQGEEGTREISTRTVYVGEDIKSSEVISNVITKEPVTHIIEKGTAKKVVEEKKAEPKNTDNSNKNVSKDNLESKKKIKMKATAYTSSSACTGKNPGDKGYGITASGMKARPGVVAVDTRVIPLGTNLYVEGYGYAIAADTGGAIKGNKIDLYFNSYSDAIKFGVKQLDVYILD